METPSNPPRRLFTADGKEARQSEAIAHKSDRIAKGLEKWAGEMGRSTEAMHAEAREMAIQGKRCEAAAFNTIADGNKEISDLLREAYEHMNSLELMRLSSSKQAGLIETMRDVISTAKENCSLMQCGDCGHLHMKGHICYSCGADA